MVKQLQTNKIGLFFGSFNPIHNGHLIIADYIVDNTPLEQIWFVVSPQNPFKSPQDLLNDKIRLHLVEIAIKGNKNFLASDVEFGLEKPSFTINTLNYLKSKHQEKEFSLIIGKDNLETFHKWKNYEEIINNHKIYVYPRPFVKIEKNIKHNNIINVEAPQIEISSTKIRENIRTKHSIRYLLPEKVIKEIQKNKYYCNS
jgi:nicotinate-nucleotide adenylyltransferase